MCLRHLRHVGASFQVLATRPLSLRSYAPRDPPSSFNLLHNHNPRRSAVKLDSRATSTPPPPLHYSPVSSHVERASSSGETTPVSTPKGVSATAVAGFPRKPERERDLLFSWHRRAAGAGFGFGADSGPSHFYADSTLLESELGDDSFPLFEPSDGDGPGAVGMDDGIGIPVGHAPLSPRPTTSTLTSALQSTSGNELRPMPGGGNAMSMGKPSGMRNDSISMSGLTPQYSSGAVPITNRNGSYQGRRESNSGSLMSGISVGGISMNSWIRDE